MDEHLKIGNPLIDEQHKALYQLLQRLAAVPDKPENAGVISDHFDRLTNLICTHFDDEEALMKQVGLPEVLLKNHVAAHTEIIKEMTNLYLSTMNGESLSLWSLCSQLSRWIVDHISESDLLLKPYIQSANQ